MPFGLQIHMAAAHSPEGAKRLPNSAQGAMERKPRHADENAEDGPDRVLLIANNFSHHAT
jgi:hypothetical protein